MKHTQTPSNDSNLAIIDLIGGPEENFYQLGKRDGHIFHELHDVLNYPCRGMLKGLYYPMEIVLKNLLKYEKFVGQDGFHKAPVIQNFAEGMGLDVHSLLFYYYLKELNFCQSFFPTTYNPFSSESTYFLGLYHNERILLNKFNFPIHHHFQPAMRFLRFKLDDFAAGIGLGKVGDILPLNYFFGVNGELLFCNQIHTKKINPQGLTILEIYYGLLKIGFNKEKMMDYLMGISAFTSWKITISFSNEENLEALIDGDRIVFNEFSMEEKKVYTFCNEVLNQELLPASIIDNMNNSKKSAELSAKNLEKISSAGFTQFFNSLVFSKDSLHLSNCPLPNVFSNALSMVATTREEIQYSYSPLSLQMADSIFSLENIWHTHLRETTQKLDAHHFKQEDEFHHFLFSHMNISTQNMERAYHHVQILISEVESQEKKNILSFFFSVFEFLHDNHKKTRFRLLETFKNLLLELPEHLQEHCQLFVIRIERIFNLSFSYAPEEFKNEQLKELFYLESKINPLILNQLLKKQTIISLRECDLFYIGPEWYSKVSKIAQLHPFSS